MNEAPSIHQPAAADPRLAVSPAEAARLAGIGRTTLYEALSCGALRSLKIGKRRLITIEALKDWLTMAETHHRLSGNR
jgi:excisionase family DNA binding protein